MSKSILIKNGTLINRGRITNADLLIKGDRIQKIDSIIDQNADKVIDAKGHWVIPGIIDDQVHFREPGLTHKADIASESRAAISGGVTSFMEMPNTKPSATTQELLQQKYDIAQKTSWCNYSFFMGTTNDNIEEVLKTNSRDVCGVKIFMGSSTGNMLVDRPRILEELFSKSPMLIATHCEDEQTVTSNEIAYKALPIKDHHARLHPQIRNVEACLKSSSFAVDLAKKHGTRLHILHISTEEELNLFDNTLPLKEKKITSEACVHHLYFTADDYEALGNQIKCNPAIKEARHAPQIFQAILDNRIDVIATDHAPHTWMEKSSPYFDAPSGLPLVANSLDIMLTFYKKGQISLEKIVEKMCHAPADLFSIVDRGYLDEGYYADLAIVDPKNRWTLEKENIYYKCGWSPLEGRHFEGKVRYTIVNGNVVFQDDTFVEQGKGMRLLFERN